MPQGLLGVNVVHANHLELVCPSGGKRLTLSVTLALRFLVHVFACSLFVCVSGCSFDDSRAWSFFTKFFKFMKGHCADCNLELRAKKNHNFSGFVCYGI